MIPSGFKKLLEKYENRYEKLIGAVMLLKQLLDMQFYMVT